MLGSVVKHFERPLVSKALYECSPFGCSASGRHSPPGVNDKQGVEGEGGDILLLVLSLRLST